MTAKGSAGSIALISVWLLHCSAAVDTGSSSVTTRPSAGGAPQGNGGAPSAGAPPSAGGSELNVSMGGLGGTMATDDCSDAAKLVYVASDANDLYSFAPDKLLFTKLGTLSCASKTVNSMAVDRSGTAWVNYSDGKIYKVDIATLACSPTSFVPQQAGFTKVLGMGFSADSVGSSSESLFVSDNKGKGVAKLDLATLTLKPLGPYTGTVAGSDAELTGTGDARLFGFFTTSPAHVAEVDKTTGATPNATLLPNVDASSGGFAFSFWGGDFWFYTAKDDPTSSVTHYVSATQMSSVVLSNIGFVIVGSGVSTCAPVVPPVPK